MQTLVGKICSLKAKSWDYLLRELARSKWLRSLQNLWRNYIFKEAANLIYKYLCFFTSKTPLGLLTHTLWNLISSKKSKFPCPLDMAGRGVQWRERIFQKAEPGAHKEQIWEILPDHRNRSSQKVVSNLFHC